MAPNSGRQQRGPGSMDPDWQTHEPGGSGEQVPSDQSRRWKAALRVLPKQIKRDDRTET